jgi:uncharacterized protein (TIGR03067 family)
MKNLVLVVVAVLLLAADKDPKKGDNKLQGTWQVTSAKARGKNVPLESLGIERIKIKGDKITLLKGAKVVKTFGLSLDPSKKPKWMNWIYEKGVSLPGIYALKGKVLRICVPMLPRKGTKLKIVIKRPKDFDTQGKPVMLLVAKRSKS